MPKQYFSDKMKTFLVDLNLDRVDLVKEGANTRAEIKLLKRKETTPMTLEEILKKLEPEHSAIVTKAIEDATKAAADTLATTQTDLAKAKEDLAKATSDLANANETIKKMKPEPKEDDIEVLMKSVNPALAKHIETLQSAVTSLVSEKAEQVAKERFETVKAIPVEEAKLKEVLKSASPAVIEVLQAASVAIEKNLLNGKGVEAGQQQFGTDAEVAYAKLEKAAKKLQESDTGLTFENAFLQACANDTETYSKTR